MYIMHKKQYDFLSALVGSLFDAPAKALVRQGVQGTLCHASLVPGRVKISRSTVMSCLKSGWVEIGTQYVTITEKGVNAVCDYRKRFTPDA